MQEQDFEITIYLIRTAMQFKTNLWSCLFLIIILNNSCDFCYWKEWIYVLIVYLIIIELTQDMHLSKTTTLSSVVSILYDRNIIPSPILLLDDVLHFTTISYNIHQCWLYITMLVIRFRDPIMNMLILLTLIISLTNANSCT